MKLATTTGDFSAYTSSQEESMRYIHQAGFQNLDYNFCTDYNQNTGLFGPEGAEHLQRVKRLADELSVQFVQAHAPMGAPIRRGDYHTAFVAATNRCIEACGELGIRNIVVHSGYEQGISKDETFDRNRDFFMELLPTAEKCGVNILVENFNKMCIDGMYWIDNAPDLRAMVDHVDHPLFHACWDAGHANMQEMPQDEALRILGEHVYALHVQDNLGSDDSHIAPFCGTLNLDALMHGLQDIGYQGYFTFESGNFFRPASQRRPYPQDERLLQAPLELRIKAEALLYEIGRFTLAAYGCLEE